MSEQRYVAASDFALVNAGLGDRDRSMYWLERAYEQRDSHLPFLHVDPRFASLRRDNPRLRALLQRLGIQR